MFNPLDPLGSLGAQFGEAAGELLGYLMTWWILAPPPLERVTQTSSIAALVGPIAVTIVTVAVLAQLARVMISGRRETLVEIALGLVKFGLINATALAAINLGMAGADAASKHLITGHVEQFGNQVNVALQGDITGTLRLFLAAVVVPLAGLQWLFLFLRQAGILVLVAMLPLAAAGVISKGTGRWFPTITTWLIGLIIYKPLAAGIYAIGMALFSDKEKNIETVLTGIMVLTLAIIALPAILTFFNWVGTNVGGGASVGGVAAGAATGAVALGSLSNFRRQETTGPGSAPGAALPGTPGAAPSATVPPGAGPGRVSPGAQAGSGAVGTSVSGATAGTGASAGTRGGGAAAAGGAAPSGAAATSGGAAGTAAAAAGPAGAAAVVAGEVAGRAVQAGRAAAGQFTPPSDSGSEILPSRGPSGADPVGEGSTT
ncbi:hypothetical protein [Pseudonocardia sp. ICBG1293]|uniref:hypothetical protein n=1 Tax=Pseudonocardia sp. ICBG1293 TaxID=2844382 RepID=UPI001CC9823B|nr:hypothetical protein [Pseudonocardia sp. ICBG1293]